MRPGTLVCLIVCKWIELTFLTCLTMFLIAGCIQMLIKLKANKDAVHLYVLSIIACIMALFNLFYNNLLLNLRFRAKNQCFSCGLCIYDLPNLIFCHTFLNKFCRDEWFTFGTIMKWSIKSTYLIVLVVLLKSWKKTHNEDINLFDSEKEDIDF